MKTAVGALAALLLLASVTGQPDPQQVANETVAKGKAAVDGLVGTAQGAVPPVPEAPSMGERLDAAAGAVGRFFAVLGQAAWTATMAMGEALGTAGAWIAAGLSAGAVALGKSGAALLAGLGALAATGLGAAMGGLLAVGAALTAVLSSTLGSYADLVGTLRPKGMDPRIFAAVAGVGASTSAAVAGYGLWSLVRKYAWLLGLAGFSRIEDSQLLEHPLRAQVFQVIQNNPGIHASELARKVGVGWGTIVHHLDKLEKGRLVTTRRVQNQKCFFEDGGKVSRQDMAIAGAMRGDSAALITAYVSAHPMTSQKQMSEELRISPALASFHVKKLTALGVLEKVRRGKQTLLTASQAVRRVLPVPATPSAPVPATA
jgi:predicted transcriptional regulator